MENASKALIIAGAILLAILLISLGILIFNQAQDTVNNSGMSEAEISTFNNKFLKYEGMQKGSVVKSLINEAIAVNSDENNTNNGVGVAITIQDKDGSNKKEMTAGALTTSGIDTQYTYDIQLSYSGGRVNKVTCIKQN